MTNEQILWTVLSSIFSGLLGVFISTYYYRRHEDRKYKLSTLQSFVGNRFNLKSERFSQSLNEIVIVFGDCKDVKIALSKFHDSLGSGKEQDALISLFKAMCQEVNVSISEFNDSFFLNPFNTVTKADQNLDRCHEIFKSLMATRAAILSPEHVRALNMISIEFPKEDYQAVSDAWKIYFDHLNSFPNDSSELQANWRKDTGTHLCQLLKVMGDALGYDFDVVDINKGIYAPLAHANVELEQQQFRQGVIDFLQGESVVKMEITNMPESN
jgi:hypothetical protein